MCGLRELVSHEIWRVRAVSLSPFTKPASFLVPSAFAPEVLPRSTLQSARDKHLSLLATASCLRYPDLRFLSAAAPSRSRASAQSTSLSLLAPTVSVLSSLYNGQIYLILDLILPPCSWPGTSFRIMAYSRQASVLQPHLPKLLPSISQSSLGDIVADSAFQVLRCQFLRWKHSILHATSLPNHDYCHRSRQTVRRTRDDYRSLKRLIHRQTQAESKILTQGAYAV